MLSLWVISWKVESGSKMTTDKQRHCWRRKAVRSCYVERGLTCMTSKRAQGGIRVSYEGTSLSSSTLSKLWAPTQHSAGWSCGSVTQVLEEAETRTDVSRHISKSWRNTAAFLCRGPFQLLGRIRVSCEGTSLS